MSFSLATCLSLIEKLSDQQINIEYHRLKNVTSTTINETNNEKSVVIRNSILNMTSSYFQRNNSLLKLFRRQRVFRKS